MKIVHGVIWLLVVSGCSGALPSHAGSLSDEHLDRIEAKLAGVECIGSPKGWERHYLHPMNGAEIDKSRIAFLYFEAGRDGFESKRVTETIDDMLLYDGSARVASGEYDVATGRVTLERCGQNLPENP